MTTLFLITSLAGAGFCQDADPVAEALAAEFETLEFIETPIDAALRRLQQMSGVPVVLDPELEGADYPVTIMLKEVSYEVALQLMLTLQELAWSVVDGVVYVQSQESHDARRAETRFYSIADLVSPLFDHPVAVPMGMPELEGVEMVGVTFDEDVQGADAFDQDMIVELIWSRVAPETWDNGIFELLTLNDTLVVRHVPEVHAEIEELLDRLRAGRGEVVSVQVRYYAVTPEELATVVDGSTRLVDAAARERLDDVGEFVHEVTLSCFHAQLVSGASGGWARFVQDVDVEVAQSSVAGDPTVATLGVGMAVEVRPLVKGNDGGVLLDLDVSVSAPLDEGEEVTAFAGAAGPTAGASGSLTSSAGGASSSFSSDQASGAILGAGTRVNRPRLFTDRLNALFEVPAGHGRIFVRGGSALDEERLAVIVVTPRVVP